MGEAGLKGVKVGWVVGVLGTAPDGQDTGVTSGAAGSFLCFALPLMQGSLGTGGGT